ncbi:MAG TPA: DsrE family protein [Dissulfurispiraceae bacterium]|nr:DsrE family protein [Dissulfurispiraceae bacterium]
MGAKETIDDGMKETVQSKNMNLGIVIYSNDPETVWNAFRLGNFSLKEGDMVKAFLLAKGVECELIDTEQFKVTEQIQLFIQNGGKLLACGTCIKIRKSEGSERCPLSTMKDLYDMVKESDRIITF